MTDPTPPGSDELDARPRGRLLHRVTRADSYVALLLLIMIDYLAISLIGTAHGGGLVQVVITSGVLLVALRISRVRRRLMLTAAGAAALALLLAIAVTVIGSDIGPVIFLICLLLVVTPIAIGQRILLHQTRVDIETLAGALDIYVLLGLFFASLYALIEHLTASAFLAQAPHATGNQLTYFSFVTLATLGYGDLTPATDLGRSLVVFEAMAGQVFLVTVIARVVSMLGADRPARVRR